MALGIAEGLIVIGAQAVLLAVASWAKSIGDKLYHDFDGSEFANKVNQQFWNPKLSWRNKWKNGDPKKGERFFGSSTFLVWTTEAWHLHDMIRNTCYQVNGMLPIGFLFGYWWCLPAFVVIKLWCGGIFEYFYKRWA